MIKRLLLTMLGFLFLCLGAVGVVLPVMPTTPFVILAALCFSAGNKKFHERLCRNRVFGPYIENYRNKQGISITLKVCSIALLWTGLAVSMVAMRTVWGFVLLGAVGVGVTIHILTIKTAPPP